MADKIGSKKSNLPNSTFAGVSDARAAERGKGSSVSFGLGVFWPQTIPANRMQNGSDLISHRDWEWNKRRNITGRMDTLRQPFSIAHDDRSESLFLCIA